MFYLKQPQNGNSFLQKKKKEKETSPSDLHFFNMSQCVEAEIYPPHHALINGARFCLLRQQ